MRLYAQTILIVGITVLAVAAILLVTFELTVMGSLSSLERDYISEDLQRAENVIFSESSRLAGISRDWGIWDDTYSFMESGNSSYLSSNFVPSALKGQNIYAIALYDTNGSIVGGIVKNWNDKYALPISESLNQIILHSSLLHPPKDGYSGILMGNDSPLMVASHDILNSDMEGPSRGVVVIINPLDNGMISDMSRNVLQNITITPLLLSSGNISPALPDMPVSSSQKVINDITGKPVLLLKIHEREDLNKSGLYSRAFLITSLLLLTLLFMGLASWLLNRIIITPLQDLNRDLLSIGRSGSLSGRIPLNRDDEIGDLTSSINSMIGSLEASHRERLTSEHRLARLVELVEEGICLVGPDNLIWFANATVGTMFETTPHALNGTCLEDLFKEGESENQNGQCITNIDQGHHEIHTKTSGGKDLWVRVTLAPYPLDTGKMGKLCVITDITQFRTAERELLLSNKKLALLGSMTRHDIVNQLTTIRGMIGLIKRKNTDSSLIQLIGGAEDAAEKINKHIEFSKEYQKAGIEEPRWQDVRTTWNLAYAMSRRRGLTFSITGEDYEIYADQLLQKVFYNLIDNTLRHGKDVFYITVSSKRDGSDLLVIYEDDGGGIPDTMKERIFERGVGTGTGWGLFFVKEVLDLTGMRICERGTYGIGAEFIITIPDGIFRPSSQGLPRDVDETSDSL